MNKGFTWHWLESRRTANSDIETNCFESINYIHYENYLDLLKGLKKEKGNFGIIQGIHLNQDFFISPEFWKEGERKFHYFKEYTNGLDFYKKIILDEGYSGEILPPPTIFLFETSNGNTISEIINKVGSIKYQWAKMYGLKDFNDAKVEVIDEWKNYSDISKKILEFEKD